MAFPIPPSLPPAELHDRILTSLLPQLHLPNLSILRTTLQILAFQSLHDQTHSSPTKPLSTALRLSTIEKLDCAVLCDLIWAYPNHGNAISTILTRRFDAQHDLLEGFGGVITSLISRLRSTDVKEVGPTLRALGGLVRAHDDILCLAVIEAKSILSALKDIYPRLKGEEGMKMKEDILLTIHRIMNASSGTGGGIEDTMKSFLGPITSRLGAETGRPFIDAPIRQDYEVVFEGGELSDEVVGKLERFQNERTSLGAVQNLISLFPYIPSTLLSQALNHTTYSGSPQPLVEAILAGGFNLPSELRELRTLVMYHSGLGPGEESQNTAESSHANANGRKYERRNIWQDEKIDMSRLKIKDHSDEAIVEIAGSDIPDHVRQSISRLVENQVMEAEEQERVLAESRGEPVRPRDSGRSRVYDDVDDEEEDVHRVRIVGEGDASGDEDVEGDSDKVVDKTRKPSKEAVYDPDLQIKLELTYLTNPAIFDRDGATRRSEGRMKLKDRTGMDDGQLEGWRVMLERNPHKDAILGRHQVIPQDYHIYLPKGGKAKSQRARGGGENGEENGGGQNTPNPPGGGGSGGRGGRGGGGGGRGRGRGGAGGGEGGGGRGRGASKGSRGHSNAARTRGHDKKMSRMGAV